jgi:inosine-uridine nucleoside N-ribohydrolase
VIAVGLDVTRKTIIDEGDIAAIASRIIGRPHGAKLTRFLEDASRFYFERMEKMLGKRIFTMHDPLAIAVALDPTLVETRQAAVDVETTGRLTTGATVVDWRGQWGRLANTEVAVAVDADRSSTRWSVSRTGQRGLGRRICRLPKGSAKASFGREPQPIPFNASASPLAFLSPVVLPLF